MFSLLNQDIQNIIVFDLEWNQSGYNPNHRMPHEIIEIGACRVNRDGQVVARFSELIRPRVYKRLDKHIKQVTGITEQELAQGRSFSDVFGDFIAWCGEDAQLVTWGRDDYPVLKRNAAFFMTPMPFDPPIDAQLVFGFCCLGGEHKQMNLHAAMELRDEAFSDLADLKKQIAGIKDDIRKLGDVNVNAIEDYKEISERYGFLKGQHDDLIEAEKTLVGIIEELDTGMRKQFMEKFAEIQREFDKVFKKLFGGGKGTLELVEDEDILECGIRIIAQPPGKKLQNMMQMSGGEKSLTAISLLFAIQNLKPSPFCLLDEIEAALDDSNVSRFAKYLHKLTKNTQFIVITHRRGTMAAADRLYGITMQEKGVSTLVSVNLIDDDLSN